MADQNSRKEVPSLPSVTLPKGGGAIRGMGEKFSANPVTGSASFNIPIPASPGRAGFGPQLSLSYDSGSGNGSFGFGWSLALPHITRKTDKGLPRYNDTLESDIFILSGVEDLVPELAQVGGSWQRQPVPRTLPDGSNWLVQGYRPRVEGAFARIERWTNQADPTDMHWRAISRENITTLYGRTANARIADPNDPLRIFSWLICESYDDKGNVLSYQYKAEDSANVDLNLLHEHHRTPAGSAANRYIKHIFYGNRSPFYPGEDLSQRGDWMFELVFDYGEHDAAVPLPSEKIPWPVRQDPFSSYRSGFEVRNFRLCRRVLMFHHFQDEAVGDNCLVRSVDFTYQEGPVASFIGSARQFGYMRQPGNTYLQKGLPPVEFTYSQAQLDPTVYELDTDSLANLPYGLDGAHYQWVDLDGEGLSGILTQQGGSLFYKYNLGGTFGPLLPVEEQPSTADLPGGRQQLLDLSGDGQLDLVQFLPPAPGFFERTMDESWESFRTFNVLPGIDWNDPNLRFVDLDGDGHADVLITEQEALNWYPSLAQDGFGPAVSLNKDKDERAGPALVFADGEQSIYLADMSGDGLIDLVRIRNGEVCYWPNTGYGCFGKRVMMSNPPIFDLPDQFNQLRIRLADIDGSGTTDIIYLDGKQVRLYFNQSGNQLSDPQALPGFPQVDALSSIMAVDLKGNGTACLVWSSPLPGDAAAPLRYVDLMGGTKPHLLVGVVNNLGAETLITYAPSTTFYAADKKAGTPWITRIPFPVQVVERVETYDRISGNRFVTRYAYHHGHFDGFEREFRGFGMVEQRDTEEFETLNSSGQFPTGTNFDAASNVPPTLTRTWYHTGVFLDRDHISDFYAGFLHDNGVGEYYREPGLTDDQARALLLPDTLLPDGLTSEEQREACRALKGLMLRQEVYAEDGSIKAGDPYSVTEQNFTVRMLQPQGENRYAVFFTHPRESIAYPYERNPADPRVTHALTLETDDFGNVLKSASAAYGRRQPDHTLDAQDQIRQGQLWITYMENGFTNPVNGPDDYRAPLPAETRQYELTGLSLMVGQPRFTFDALLNAGSSAAPIDYEQAPSGALEKRLIEHTRTLYRKNDLTGTLPLGQLDSMALPFESYKQAFTTGLVSAVYGPRVSSTMLANGGRYVNSQGDANWWIPSGQLFYSPNSSDTPAQELAYAQAHFFLPLRYRDPFHTSAASTESFVRYDDYDLLVLETRDALENRVTAGERDKDPTKPLVQRGLDYRVLQPALVMDPNRNRSQVVFDVLGLVAASAVMGKPEDSPALGDSLPAGYPAELTQAQIDAFLADPISSSAGLVGSATTRVIYDVTCYWLEPDPLKKPPVYAATLARETHSSDPIPAGGLKVQVSFSYSDGFGREIQKKIQAEPGPVPMRDPSTGQILLVDGQPQMTPNAVNPRWVCSGWTVFNNKGKPVRQYEPFFTDTPRFELDVRIGVSPVLCYDPLDRVVATLNPNHTWEKVVFDAWQQQTWDANDNVLAADPKTDPDVGDYFRRLPDADYLPTWYSQRQGGALGPSEQDAANKAAVHAGTPGTVYFDPLGRSFLTLAHNKFKRSDSPPAGLPLEEFYKTRSIYDIEGNRREACDELLNPPGPPLERVVMRYDYDMLGAAIHQASMEAGERWQLNDAAGKTISTWNSREFQLTTTYDPLRRPLDTILIVNGAAGQVVSRVVYGESLSKPEIHNQRGKAVQAYDQAGQLTTGLYDFKGNLLQSQRQLAVEYRKTLDWSAPQPLEAPLYTTQTRYDALNRAIEVTTPDHSVLHPVYNEANLLETIRVNLGGAAALTPFVTNIDYDAKGQRVLIEYGNGAQTSYEYDPETFRLAHLLTTRPAGSFPGDCPQPPPSGWPGCQVQNLTYTYDPVGNITAIRDDAQQTVFFRNRRVEPSAGYTYDALYRLIEASGREHLGQAGSPTPPDAFDAFRTRLSHPGDGNALGTYLESYAYDAAGNLLSMQHHGTDPSNPGWTRSYAYNETSQLEAARVSNRLSSTTLGAVTESYPYDSTAAAGFAGLDGLITGMPNLSLMQWDFRDQLQASARQAVNSGTPETTWYVYDSNGQRVRKVTDRQGAARKQERIYLGGYEVFRTYKADGQKVKLERETLHVTDDKSRAALVETRTQGQDAAPGQLIRYQYSNHLGSSLLELDNQAQVISHEEYYPYGGTAYQAVRSQAETPKRYRYTGKERDEENGFYYHGARYYAPWLGRWTSTDPIGIKEGLNLYVFGNNNPVRYRDPEGKAPEDTNRISQEDFKKIEERFQSADFKERLRLTNEYHLKISPSSGRLVQDLPKGTSELLKSSVSSQVITQVHERTKNTPLLMAAVLAGYAAAVGIAFTVLGVTAVAKTVTTIAVGIYEDVKILTKLGAIAGAAYGAYKAFRGGSKSETPTLIGTDESTFRRDAERLIRNTEDHPLRFLLDDTGHFRRTRGLTHAELIDQPDLVQMGHVVSKKTGQPERIILESAYYNQLDNLTIERSSKGGAYLEHRTAVDIGGIAVEIRTANDFEKYGFIPKGTVAKAKKIDLSQ